MGCHPEPSGGPFPTSSICDTNGTQLQPARKCLAGSALDTADAAGAQDANDMELMGTIATHYAHNKDLSKAIQGAISTKPKCMDYIDAIGNFAKYYSEGEDFVTINV